MKRDLALWTGFLAGPLVWFLSFGARWSLSGWVCAFQWKPALFVIALIVADPRRRLRHAGLVRVAARRPRDAG